MQKAGIWTRDLLISRSINHSNMHHAMIYANKWNNYR